MTDELQTQHQTESQVKLQTELQTEHQINLSTDVKKESKKKGLWAGLAFILAILAKGKFFFVFLITKFKFLFIFLKLGKFLSTGISMFITIGIYALIYGVKYAIGIVALLFLHEIGHYIIAKRVGLAVSGPVFIPFVGAFIGMKEMPKDAVTEAKVGYGGPLFGSLGAVVCLGAYWATGSKLALALAYTGFLLNLFNLLPVHPLDGGRIVSAVSPYLWLIGIPVLVFLMFWLFNPIMVLIVVLGLTQVYKLWKNRDQLSVYYEVPMKERVQFAILYFGLVGILGLGLSYALELLR